MRVEQVDNLNQFAIIGEGESWFQSYQSTIAHWDGSTLTLGRDWDYSKTTLKHLYIYLSRYVHLDALEGLEWSNNKRLFIQKAIDRGAILYDKKL